MMVIMTKKRTSVEHDNNIINALKELPNPIFDKKHGWEIYFNDVKSRSNETRFEHIAKAYHQLKVRDIKLVAKGINNYVAFIKDNQLKDTYSYIMRRGGRDKGFIKLTILVDINNKTIAYVKSIYIVYRIK